MKEQGKRTGGLLRAINCDMITLVSNAEKGLPQANSATR